METDGTSARNAPAFTGLAAALAYAAKGIPVFPIVPCEKKPATKNGFYDATTDEATIRAWWQRNPRFNVGIPTGSADVNERGWRASGWVVVDIDPRDGGSLDDLVSQRGPIPPTLTARTGSGGWHLIFRHTGGSIPTSKALGKGYDIKSDGGYIMVAPSIHPNGNPYRWEDSEATVADMPNWLVRAIAAAELPRREVRDTSNDPRANGEQRPSDGRYWLERALARVAEMGQRDNNGLWLAQQLLWNDVFDPEDIMLAYADAVPIVPGDPYTGKDAIRNLNSARRQPKRTPAKSQALPRPKPERKKKKPALHIVKPPEEDGDEDGGKLPPGPPGEPGEAKQYPLTEMGNAERLLAAYGENMRYNKALDFIVYDGKCWRPESALVVRKWAKQTVRRMYSEASQLALRAASATDDGDRQRLAGDAEALSSWARKSETARMVDAMLKLVMAECYVDVSVFDSQPFLFNCANGTLDLRTGVLREHRREDSLMQWSPVTFTTLDERAPRFEKFVRQIMRDRQQLVDYLQRALGYSLTGSVGEQIWHLLHGEGENGKSTLMEIIEAVLADYAATLEPETITAGGVKRDGGAPSPDIAKLKGKRFVKITETEEGARIAPARIKKLSGGDRLTARFLNRDLFEFQPTFKLFIYTNHKPQTREMTHAFWRRVRLVPFEWSVAMLPEGEEKDANLKEKIITQEASGVLAWLVRGCLAWQHEGLNPPAEVTEATDKYKDDMDVLGKFLGECCTVGTPYQASAKALWTAWKQWCDENNEREGTQRSFGMALGKRPEGFKKDHRRDGDWWYGLEVVSD